MLTFSQISQRIFDSLSIEDLPNDAETLVEHVYSKSCQAVDWNTALSRQFCQQVTIEECLAIKEQGMIVYVCYWIHWTRAFLLELWFFKYQAHYVCRVIEIVTPIYWKILPLFWLKDLKHSRQRICKKPCLTTQNLLDNAISCPSMVIKQDNTLSLLVKVTVVGLWYSTGNTTAVSNG